MIRMHVNVLVDFEYIISSHMCKRFRNDFFCTPVETSKLFFFLINGTSKSCIILFNTKMVQLRMVSM